MGPPSSPSSVTVPVSKSQGLGVGGGDDEADGWSGQLLPSAVCQLPALPVVLLQCVAIAPRDQALVGTDPSAQIHSQAWESQPSSSSGPGARRSQLRGNPLDC